MWVVELYANISGRRKWEVKDTLRTWGGTEAIKRYINADVSSRNRSVDISRLYDCRGGVASLTGSRIYLKAFTMQTRIRYKS